MAMTRAEIELIIRARNQGRAAFQELSNDMAAAKRAADGASTAVDRESAAVAGAGRAAGTAAREFSGLAASQQQVGQGASAATASQQKLQAEIGKTTQAAGGMGRALTSNLAIGAAGGAAFAVLNAMSGAIADVGQQAIRLGPLRESFVRLEGGAAAADKRLASLRSATRGFLADVDLMQSANRANVLGLNALGVQYADVARYAVTLGRAVGTDATTAIEQFTLALAKGSSERLDELGIQLKLSDAYKIYAERLGKTTSQLTEFEQRQAFATIGMERAREKVQALGEQQYTVWEQTQRVTRALTDMAVEVVSVGNESRGLAGWLDGVANALERIRNARPGEAGDIVAGMLNRAGRGAWNEAQQAYDAAPWYRKLDTAFLYGPKQWSGRLGQTIAPWFGNPNYMPLPLDPLSPTIPAMGPSGGAAGRSGAGSDTALISGLRAEVARLKKELQDARAGLRNLKTAADQPLSTTSFLSALGFNGARFGLAESASERAARIYRATGIAGALQPGAGDPPGKGLIAGQTPLSMAQLQQAVQGTRVQVRDLNVLAEESRSLWRDQVLPDVSRSIELTQQAVMGSFAQMLLGAKSFGDGWTDIWRSIAGGTMQIIGSMFAGLAQASFQGLIGTVRGQSGAWGRAFSGIGQAGATAGMFGMGGGSAAGTAGIGGAIPTAGVSGTGVASSGVSATTMAGLAGAAGGGVVGGMVGYKTGNTALGMTAGAATGVGAAMAAGAMKGAAFGPWGILIGAGVGAAAGYIGAAMRKRKERKLDRKADEEIFSLQSDLTDQYGSQERIKRMGDMVGVDLAGAWGSRKREGLAQFEATAKAFEERQKLLASTMDEYGLSWENLGEQARKSTILDITDQLLAKQQILKTAGVDQTAIVKAQAGQYNELIAAVLRTGDTLPTALQPVLKQLSEMGLLTDENKRKLLGMTNAVAVDFKAMEEAAKRYGIDLNSLGAQFQGARIAADAQQIAKDFDMLIAQGADAGGVLFGMREEISQIVQQSVKFGTEIPENMRPLIEELSRSGLLLDENGEKIADLSKLKFAAPLEEGFDKVVTAIEKLSGVMTDQLPKDAAEARRRLQEALESGEWSPIRIPFEFVPTNAPTGAPPSGDLPGAANGVFATGPTFRVFAEKEPELGGPVSFMTKVLAGAMEAVGALGGPQISLSFNIGGTGDPVTLRDTIRREVVPEIVKAIAGNVGGSRSNLRTALGVS